MSLPSPHDGLSPRESLYASVKLRFVTEGTERLVAWGGKAQGRQRPSLTPQAPVRSVLASIAIVAACTSSLMITSALGSAVTISLPYVGKDLNVQKDELQWVLSAYSISSVRMLYNTVSKSLAYLMHRHASFSFVGDLQIFTGANSSGLLDT
jgi:hypothetical protein